MDVNGDLKVILERLSKLENSQVALKEENRVLRARLETLEMQPSPPALGAPLGNGHHHGAGYVSKVLESSIGAPGASTLSASSMLSATSRPHKPVGALESPLSAREAPPCSGTELDGAQPARGVVGSAVSASKPPHSTALSVWSVYPCPQRPPATDGEVFLSPSVDTLPCTASPPTVIPNGVYQRSLPASSATAQLAITTTAGTADTAGPIGALASTDSAVGSVATSNTSPAEPSCQGACGGSVGGAPTPADIDTTHSPPEFALVGFGSHPEIAPNAREEHGSPATSLTHVRGHTPLFRAAKEGDTSLSRLATSDHGDGEERLRQNHSHHSGSGADDDAVTKTTTHTSTSTSGTLSALSANSSQTALRMRRAQPTRRSLPAAGLSPFSRSLSDHAGLPSATVDEADTPRCALSSHGSTPRTRLSIVGGMTVESVSRTLIQEMAKIMMDMQRMDKEGKETAKRLRQETQSRRATAKKLVYKLAELTDVVWNVYDRLAAVERSVLGTADGRDDGTEEEDEEDDDEDTNEAADSAECPCTAAAQKPPTPRPQRHHLESGESDAAKDDEEDMDPCTRVSHPFAQHDPRRAVATVACVTRPISDAPATVPASTGGGGSGEGGEGTTTGLCRHALNASPSNTSRSSSSPSSSIKPQRERRRSGESPAASPSSSTSPLSSASPSSPASPLSSASPSPTTRRHPHDHAHARPATKSTAVTRSSLRSGRRANEGMSRRPSRRFLRPHLGDQTMGDDDNDSEEDVDKDRPVMLDGRALPAVTPDVRGRHRRGGERSRQGHHRARGTPRARLSKRTNSQRMVPMKVVLDNAGKSFSLQSSVGNSLCAHPPSSRLNISHPSDGSVASTLYCVEGGGSVRFTEMTSRHASRPHVERVLPESAVVAEEHGRLVDSCDVPAPMEEPPRGFHRTPPPCGKDNGQGHGSGSSVGAPAVAATDSVLVPEQPTTTSLALDASSIATSAAGGPSWMPGHATTGTAHTSATASASTRTPSPPSGLIHRQSGRDSMSPTARFRANRASTHLVTASRTFSATATASHHHCTIVNSSAGASSTATTTAMPAAKNVAPAFSSTTDVAHRQESADGGSGASSSSSPSPPRVSLNNNASDPTAVRGLSPLAPALPPLHPCGPMTSRESQHSHHSGGSSGAAKFAEVTSQPSTACDVPPSRASGSTSCSVGSLGVSAAVSEPPSAMSAPLALTPQPPANSHVVASMTGRLSGEEAILPQASLAQQLRVPQPAGETTLAQRDAMNPSSSNPIVTLSNTIDSPSSTAAVTPAGSTRRSQTNSRNSSGSRAAAGATSGTTVVLPTRPSGSAGASARMVPSAEAVLPSPHAPATAVVPVKHAHNLYNFPPVSSSTTTTATAGSVPLTLSSSTQSSTEVLRRAHGDGGAMRAPTPNTTSTLSTTAKTVVPSLSATSSGLHRINVGRPFPAATIEATAPPQRLSVSAGSSASTLVTATAVMPAFLGGSRPGEPTSPHGVNSVLLPRLRGSVSSDAATNRAGSGNRSRSPSGGGDGSGGGGAVPNLLRLYRRQSRKLGSASVSPPGALSVDLTACVPSAVNGDGPAVPPVSPRSSPWPSSAALVSPFGHTTSTAANTIVAAAPSLPHSSRCEEEPLLTLFDLSYGASLVAVDTGGMHHRVASRPTGELTGESAVHAAAAEHSASSSEDFTAPAVASGKEKSTVDLQMCLAVPTGTRPSRPSSVRGPGPAPIAGAVSGHAHAITVAAANASLRPSATPLTSCLVTSVPANVSGGAVAVSSPPGCPVKSTSLCRARAPPLNSMMMTSDPGTQPLEGCEVSVSGAAPHRVSITAPSPTEIDRDRRKRQEEALSQALINKMLHHNR